MDLSPDILYLILRCPPPSSLFHAALVSRAWNLTSTALLYSRPLLLGSTDVEERFEQLVGSLRGHEELRARVVQLVIPVRGREKDRPRLEAVEEVLGLCTGVQGVVFEGMTNVFLRPYLSATPTHLTSLSITSHTSPNDHTTLSTSYLSSRLFLLPHLHNLTLSDFASPPLPNRWIKPAYKLRSLRLERCALGAEDLESVVGESGETLECAEVDLGIRLPGPVEKREKSRSVLPEQLVALFSRFGALEKLVVDLSTTREEGMDGRTAAVGVFMRKWDGEVVVRLKVEAFLERGGERFWEGTAEREVRREESEGRFVLGRRR